MRILIVTPMYPPDRAGIALQSSMLVEGLAASGHKCHVLAYSPRDASPGDAAADQEDVTRVDRGLRHRRFSPRLWWTLRGLASAADLVHVHGYTNLNSHAWLARRGRPMFFTYHGTEVWHHDPNRGGRLFRGLTASASIICVSQPLADALAQKTGLASAVVEPAIEDVYIHAAQTATPAQKADFPLVLNVKGLYPVGGHDALVRAMARVCRDSPQAQLWIAGMGPLQPKLEALAQELGIGGNVKFLGLLDGQELANVYANAWVFANTATLESYGNVTVEALACGTRAVACETAGATALARQFPRDIQLVPQDDLPALANALLAGLARPAPVCRGTLDTIAEEKSAAAMTQKYLALYQAGL